MIHRHPSSQNSRGDGEEEGKEGIILHDEYLSNGKEAQPREGKEGGQSQGEAGKSNNQVTNERQQFLAKQMQQLQVGNSNLLPTSGSDATKCRHGFEKLDNMCIDFVIEFRDAFHEAGNRGKSTLQSLVYAEDTTMDKFAVVWKDFAKMEIIMSFIEQCIAVELHQTQAIMNWSKVEAMSADEHTRVKFYRRRIPCSCLEKKYGEVKTITKMGLCFNQQCPDRRVERSKTMYCSGCRCITYCSRECHKASWSGHKEICVEIAAKRKEFEAEKES
eukprot:scaffold1505_cov146-Skeletonema_marinoi.AAC.22